jgi:3-dehydroquinate dehydratase II
MTTRRTGGDRDRQADGPQSGRRTAQGADQATTIGTVLLLSGPNLGLLGRRQPEIYGSATLESHVAAARSAGARVGLAVEHVQSEHEGSLIEAVHAARGRCAAIVVNAGALSHTSWSLHDALAAFDGVVVEVHLSNPAAREPWRHTSVLAPVAAGSIAGFGGLGYELAIEAVRRILGGDTGDVRERPEESGAVGQSGDPAVTAGRERGTHVG